MTRHKLCSPFLTHHIHTDCVYVTDYNEKIHKNDILTLLLLAIRTKNHLNAAGVFSVALSLIVIMLQAIFSP